MAEVDLLDADYKSLQPKQSMWFRNICGLIQNSIQKEYINPFSNETDASGKVTLAKGPNFPKVVEINKNTLGSLNLFKVSESVEQ